MIAFRNLVTQLMTFESSLQRTRFFLDCDFHIYEYTDDDCISYSSDTIDDIQKFLTKDIIIVLWTGLNKILRRLILKNPSQ